jgi:hypothetical protein
VNSRVCRSYVEGELSRAKAQQAPYRHEKCVAVSRSSILDFADEVLCGYVCVRNHFRMERKSCVDASVIGQGSQFFNLHEGSTHRKPFKLDVFFEDRRQCKRYCRTTVPGREFAFIPFVGKLPLVIPTAGSSLARSSRWLSAIYGRWLTLSRGRADVGSVETTDAGERIMDHVR